MQLGVSVGCIGVVIAMILTMGTRINVEYLYMDMCVCVRSNTILP